MMQPRVGAFAYCETCPDDDPNFWMGLGPQGQKMCAECLAELEVAVKREESPKEWSEYLNDEYDDVDR